MTDFDPQQLTFEFIEAFDAPKDVELWSKLVKEETEEVYEAAAHLIKELADLAYVTNGLIHTVEATTDDPATHASLFEQHLPNDQTIAFVGALLNGFPEKVRIEAFRRVHASNMSKLGDDGKPVRREDGKILKGPNYKPPVLDDLLR